MNRRQDSHLAAWEGRRPRNQPCISPYSHHPNPQALLGCQSGRLLSAALCRHMVGGPFPASFSVASFGFEWVVPVTFGLSFPNFGTFSSFALLPTGEMTKHRCSVPHLLFGSVDFQFCFFRVQAGLELLILLPHSPKCWVTGRHHHALLLCAILIRKCLWVLWLAA